MRRLLVTGGSGYLGREVVRRAAAAGWDALGTVFSAPGPARLDVRDPVAVRELVDRMRPTAVIHTAYRQHGDGAQATTVDGAGHVATAAAAVGARLVHLSTDVVFDGRAGRPYTEDDPPAPCTAYGRWKARAEWRVLAAHPGACVVRTSLIVGGDGSSAHERLVLDVVEGRVALAFFTDEIRCPIHVGDLAEALLELLDRDLAGPLHVAGPQAVSRWELARLVSGRDDLPSTRSADRPEPRPLDCRLDCARALGALRSRPRPVAELYGASRSTRQPPAPSGA